MSAVSDDAVTAAWQQALAAEQQAAYGYALLGPHLPASRPELTDLARSCQALHEDLRDRTAGAIAAAGAVPSAARGDYPQLYGVAALTLAGRLENDCAAAWRYLYAVAATAGGSTSARTSAQRNLTASAVRATRWLVAAGAARPAPAFPGT